MQNSKKDYTNFFRNLHNIHEPKSIIFEDAEGKAWSKKFEERFGLEKVSIKKAQQKMLANNPKYILRNYLAHQAIKKAEQNDFSEIEVLMNLLSQPFESIWNTKIMQVVSDWGVSRNILLVVISKDYFFHRPSKFLRYPFLGVDFWKNN